MQMITDYTANNARTRAIKAFEEKVHEYLNSNGFVKITKLISELAEYYVGIEDFDILEYLENMRDREVIQSFTYVDIDHNRERTVLYPNIYSNIKIGAY